VIRIILLGFIFFLSNGISAAEVLEKIRVSIDGKELLVEVADTDASRSRGLMHRKSMPKDQGMLFVFEKPQVLTFWMKNTLIPLSIGFFDKDFKLINTHEMKPPGSALEINLPRFSSEGPALFALEANANWFVKNKIKKGSRLLILGKTKSKLLSGPKPIEAPKPAP
jgi:uncharacterized membrane protein (UPF0127 family)